MPAEHHRAVFLDLDDCVVGRIWPLADRPRQPIDREVFGQFLTTCHRAGVSVHLLTNRPPAQLPVIGHIIGGAARYHLAESGLSAWLPDQNRAIVNPEYQDFAQRVIPELVALLRERLAISPDGPVIEEYGERLVTYTIFPLNGGEADVAALLHQVHDILEGFPVEMRHGKGVDIMPAGANKAAGCRWAEELHPHFQGEPLYWRNVLYIEDSTTGAEAARYIFGHGGQVAAVANAHPQFRSLVAAANGIICNHEHEFGALEALRRWLSI
jgi:hydroxymethylpyrimidine pyrophosphatase-like HAD family hydrolase